MIDTAQKRFSMMGFGDGNQILFEPDGSVDLDDRQHLLGGYSGIAFSTPSLAVPDTIVSSVSVLLSNSATVSVSRAISSTVTMTKTSSTSVER